MNEGLEKMISEQLMILGNQFDLEGSDWDFLGASLRTLAKASREEAYLEGYEKGRCELMEYVKNKQKESREEALRNATEEIGKKRDAIGDFNKLEDDYAEGVWIGYNSAIKIIESLRNTPLFFPISLAQALEPWQKQAGRRRRMNSRDGRRGIQNF